LRVLLAVGEIACANEQDRYEGTRAVDGLAWFDARCTIRVHVEARASLLRSLQFATLRASDRDPRAVAATRAKLEAAGLAADARLACGDVLERAAPAAAGVMLANPLRRAHRLARRARSFLPEAWRGAEKALRRLALPLLHGRPRARTAHPARPATARTAS